jgi:hypothetical protein
MPRKSRRKPETRPETTPTATVEALKRRRNRRLLFVGLIALSVPILEGIAYRFRAITMVVDNRTDGPITRLKVTYPGGSIEEPEIKPGGVVSRVICPDFSFHGSAFSTYRLTIQFSSANGAVIKQIGRAGALDYSATEKYVIETTPPDGQVQIHHKTSPGFPLGTVGDLLAGLGIG